jgi:hypothetical protein
MKMQKSQAEHNNISIFPVTSHFAIKKISNLERREVEGEGGRGHWGVGEGLIKFCFWIK